MKSRYRVDLCLEILGPLLTAATGPDAYGLDRSFYRNIAEELAIPETHIKGRLRMALEEIIPHASSHAPPPDLDLLFGAPSALNEYEPDRGLLRFTELVCTTPARVDARRARVAMQPASLTAADNLLQSVEDPFPSGLPTTWTGDVTFYADDLDHARRIAGWLHAGFCWLPNLGADKGVGFGRIRRVSVAAPVLLPAAVTPVPAAADDSLHLRILPRDLLLVGGIKSRRTNFVRSRREFSGGLVKGALAMALNEAYGFTPLHCPLETHAADFTAHAALAAHFSALRVTLALPAPAAGPRPVRLPLSAVQHDGVVYDLALSTASAPLIDDQAPVFAVDWKGDDDREYIDAAMPQEIFITRTAVDDESRRADDGLLFTYAFLSPHDDAGNTVEWICNVDFHAVPAAARAAVRTQFIDAVQRYLTHLGKTGRAVDVAVRAGAAPAAVAGTLVRDGWAVITLQSDAVMLAPESVSTLHAGDDLHGQYAAYWSDLSRDAQGNPTLELDDFFADQAFEGGYLYHRYLGAHERQADPFRYRPYFLTRAGSVFRLRVLDEAAARPLLGRWLAEGLPLPPWAVAAYTRADAALWECCPFVPQSGYGEICINLDWHWQKAVPS